MSNFDPISQLQPFTISQFWPNFTIMTNFDKQILRHLSRISQFQHHFTILTDFHKFAEFYNFDRLSQLYPVLTQFHNFAQFGPVSIWFLVL